MTPTPADPTPVGPRFTRRFALLGAAALLAPLPRVSLAAPGARHMTPGLVLLDGNENPYGPSPMAREAILESIPLAPRYADSAVEHLVGLLAAEHRVPVAQILVGTGSGELLKMAGLYASRGAGGELVAAVPTYEELPGFAAKLGLTVRGVPVDATHRHDPAAMRAAIGPATRAVYVCNPNNPTGTLVARAALEPFIRSVPTTTLVVVDEAYIHLADDPVGSSVASLVGECPNLVVLRTFSKIHGLAGLRVGYGITSPSLAAGLANYALTYPNAVGIAAATASLADHEFLSTTRTALLADRARIEAAIDKAGLARAVSQGNFVFFDTGRSLKLFQDAMLARGIKVGRRFDGYDRWARVTVGTQPEVDRFLAALPAALG